MYNPVQNSSCPGEFNILTSGDQVDYVEIEVKNK